MRRFERLELRTIFSTALDASGHGGWRGLHDALVNRHEAWIRQCPAALEDPRRTGAWEEAATAESWGLPARLSRPT